jgi:hypothetical protein
VGAWTFDSAHVDGTNAQQVPLISMRIRPNLNERGQSLRGVTLQIPLSVYQLGHVGTFQPTDVAVQASFDDGATWQEVTVARAGKQWSLEMRHPKQGDYVSLRMSARGMGNDRVEQTIMRAYGLTDATAH